MAASRAGCGELWAPQVYLIAGVNVILITTYKRCLTYTTKII